MKRKMVFWGCVACAAIALVAGCHDDDGDDDDEVLQVQVDRMGRPGVNTVLIGSASKDDYNQADDPATWAALFQDEMAANLMTVDGLDGVPGNLLLGDANALAGVLVDDRLIIDTSQPDCEQYLAVELGVAGDCGGRTLTRDVVDDTLTALVGSPVSDNVDNDSAFLLDFPFLGPPNGNQIDRMGRPGINTVLIGSNLKDAYNRADDPATWAALFQDEMAANLMTVDGLDGVPGNLLLGDANALAGVLVDDRLIIDTSQPDCEQYLAVELRGLGGDPDDCGGRTLTRDVVDDTLTALVGSPVSDNVDNDSVFQDVFPFLGESN